MHELGPDAGSYRDPRGRVFVAEDRVLRTVAPSAAADFEFVRSTGVLPSLIAEGLVIAEEQVEPSQLSSGFEDARYVLQHPKLPFISYPYEWCFTALKRAALFHLDIQIRCLEQDVALSDASAYNIQFLGPQPIFIDSLSFRRYHEGEFWVGHKQFCEQFLNPLLLRALLGVPHNAWYRGGLEGIPTAEVSRLLPLRRKLSWNVLTNVVMQASFQRAATGGPDANIPAGSRFPRRAMQRMLLRLHKWISALEPADRDRTVWRDYAPHTSYAADEADRKRALVAEFAASVRPRMIWDIGCNRGDYAKAALEAGAGYAVGFDSDQGALEAAFMRSQRENLALLPLILDLGNPSPSQGWAERERRGLSERASADAILALALVHHLAIGRNVPLDEVVAWLVGLAPHGVIEFVPKSDPMVQRLLRLREDIFDDYSEEVFLKHLDARAEVVRTVDVSATGRRLFWFARREHARLSRTAVRQVPAPGDEAASMAPTPLRVKART
jgi:ribosomal protein L11 methylase PrmA